MSKVFPLLATCLIVATGCTKRTPVEEISIEQSGISVNDMIDAREADLAWPQWRGGTQGVSSATGLPTQWSEQKNVRWQADIPGRGHSSPVVVDDLVVLGTATKQPEAQLIIAYDRDNGTERWRHVVHSGGLPVGRDVHPKATNANGTIASDGKTFFTAHLNSERIWVTAVDTEGELIWQTDIGAFNSKFGYAPSPILYKSLLIVAADNQGGGYLVGIDAESGQIAWRRSRGDVSSYSSPALVTLGGVDQVVITGTDRMVSYDPATGQNNWETPCISEATCGTVVATEDRVFASGGYPDRETVCLDARGERVWSNRTKIYEPSMVTDGKHLFAISDDGIAYCWSVIDGATKWKKRLGGNFSSSPVIADGNLYVSDLSGNGFVIRVSGESFSQIAKNRLGNDCYASPTIAGDSILFRVGLGEGSQRRERLYCISESEAGSRF